MDQSLSSASFGKDQVVSMSWELRPQFIFGDDQKDARISHNSSPETVCMASKRSEHKSFCSSTPFCKVYGCNKNLSSCKEYYKRHKVCEVHSKTYKVIVNGIEQRFCQQCSRFHLLREFDDGKRSCRKRLAGHNERRRKPHVGAFFERHGRLVPSYSIGVQGNEFKESAGAISSFHNPNDLNSPYKQMHKSNVRWDMNLEDRNAHDLQSTSSGITDEQLPSKSVSPSIFETDPRFINKWIIRDSITCSESAYSLLSSHSSRIQTSNSQSRPVFLGSHDMNPMLGFQGDLVKFGMMYYDDQVLRDESCTVDLLQLSAQLDRVEHQKHVNPAN
ncbi:hypothetical protein L1987_23330 [Smallanthus sonchifolius]|uniref:Uncharacterized protein n=1 Tax=Smallanthus sonchifolius TaxID=185202 RepID=A0ACB9II89_9ASTR|nr:hypothetical protein L1987_23330 [Smallanthus sonchifolius]